MRTIVSLAILILVLGVVLGAEPARAAFYWVGNGGMAPCTHATLPAAIATAQLNTTHDVIFVVGNVTLPGDLTILPGGGYDLQITGGVPACGSTEVTTVSTIAAGAGQRGLTIAAGPGETVTLWNLEVTNQNGYYGGHGGAIYFTGASAFLVLVHTVVRDSSCLGDGGGLYVNSGSVELEGLTTFHDNVAANGGGIALNPGGNGKLILTRGAVIGGNTAALDGGGIYAGGGEIEFLGASDPYPAAIVSNVAGEYGGGVFFGASSYGGFEFRSIPTVPIEIALNQAGSGGGLYVESAETILLGNAVVEQNEATLGGGLYVVSGGRVAPAYSPGAPTRDLPLFQGNVANDGKAVYMTGGLATLSGTFTGHQPGATDSALFTVVGGSLVLDGAVVHHNSAVRLADLYGPSPYLLFVYTTVSDNVFDALVLDAHVPPPPPGAELAEKYFPFPVLELTNSVFAETEPLYAPPLPTAEPILDCLVSRYASMLVSLPVGSSTAKVLYGDPRFANAAAGDYHVAIASPVVDLCMPRNGIVLPDPDGDLRGTDAANTANPAGRTFDAGADEISYLFADDFEIANTSRWSATVP